MKKSFFIFCVLFLQSTLINAQIKIEGRVDPIQDTIYLNEPIHVDYYSSELLRDEFSHFPLPRKFSDSLYEYIVCGGQSKGSLYLGCAAFRFKKPGVNIIPKIFYKFANTDTIWSYNTLSVYVLDDSLDEKSIFRKKHLDKFIEDSLSNEKTKRLYLIVDSLSNTRCGKSKPYLRSSKEIYKAKINQGFEIEFSTDYLCLNCENYQIHDSDTSSSRNQFVLKTVYCDKFKSDLEYNAIDFIDFEAKIERTKDFQIWDYNETFNLKEIQNNFNKFDRITQFKTKVKYKKAGVYNYKASLIDATKKSLISKQIKVIIEK